MLFSIITLFPEIFAPLESSIIGRARKQKLIEINFVNPRDFATDKHQSVDDRPYGGGAGMIMRVDILDKAISFVKHQAPGTKRLKPKTVLLDPQGKKFDQEMAKKLSSFNHLILICGHYEGVDERVGELVDERISIGDYILTGGEIPAMVLVDSITRLLPRALSKSEAALFESFSTGLLEYPQYTRPEVYNNMKVPQILLSGNHAAIAKWQKIQAKLKTKLRRPDLLSLNT